MTPAPTSERKALCYRSKNITVVVEHPEPLVWHIALYRDARLVMPAITWPRRSGEQDPRTMAKATLTAAYRKRLVAPGDLAFDAHGETIVVERAEPSELPDRGAPREEASAREIELEIEVLAQGPGPSGAGPRSPGAWQIHATAHGVSVRYWRRVDGATDEVGTTAADLGAAIGWVGAQASPGDTLFVTSGDGEWVLTVQSPAKA